MYGYFAMHPEQHRKQHVWFSMRDQFMESTFALKHAFISRLDAFGLFAGGPNLDLSIVSPQGMDAKAAGHSI
jgi:hypothetical protein